MQRYPFPAFLHYFFPTFNLVEQKNYNVIGVMSGTSLDGVDLAYVKITIAPRYSYTFLATQTVPYARDWQDRLQRAVHDNKEGLHQLNIEYTHYLTDVIQEFIKNNSIHKLDAVCSHGHTILHQPEQGVTLQIGNLPELAHQLKATVVCDFRVQDVALGGQGAPLVPIGDQLLFDTYDYCLNLGGFANCSYADSGGKRIAYDICPVNVVLNRYARELGKAYDDKGAFAKAGTVQPPLLQKLNALSFYKMAPPKSLGIEWVQDTVFPLLKPTENTPIDILATFTEHIAMQLAMQFEPHSSILVTGGGAYNTHLIERITAYNKIDIRVPDAQLIEYKEALIFGLLGVLRLCNEINCLSSVTGATQDHSSGCIYKNPF